MVNISRDSRASFVVRVVQGQRGEVRGIIERVATGAKEAFTGIEAIGQVIAEMLRAETPRDEQGAGARALK